MNFDSIKREGIIKASSLFVNDDKRNGGLKISFAFKVVARLINGEVIDDAEWLPDQRRFKTDLTIFHGKDEARDQGAFVIKVNSLRECLGLSKIATASVNEIMEITKNDFMELKKNDQILRTLAVWLENPTVQVETIHGLSHRFQWANSMFFRPEFREMINPKAPKQGELF